MIQSSSVVVLFDGVCNLCNSSVQFLIKRDTNRIFKFASLQSEYGQRQLTKFGLPPDGFYSVVVIANDKIYQQSDAILVALKNLRGVWGLFYFFKVLPRFLRDAIYSFVARNRYRFFGKKDQCMIPTPELRDRFLE